MLLPILGWWDAVALTQSCSLRLLGTSAHPYSQKMWVVFIPFVLFHFFVLPFIHCFGSTANIFLREELLALVSIPKQIFNANCHWVWTLLSQRHWAECSILCSWWFQWIWLMLKLWGQKRVHAKLFLAAFPPAMLLLFLVHEQVLELLRVWHSCCLVVYIQIEAVSKIDEGRLKKNSANEFGLLNSKKNSNRFNAPP